MGALELDYEVDWRRYRVSFFYASGDDDINDGVARGFDAIVDNPQFAGGGFLGNPALADRGLLNPLFEGGGTNLLNRQTIPLTGAGVALFSFNSLLPSLRSNKFQGQANFLNPGVMIFNAGTDAKLTPKLIAQINVNYLRFDRTEVLEAILFQSGINKSIGVDAGFGFQYRPFLNDNIVITGGFGVLKPGAGLRRIYPDVTLFSGVFEYEVPVLTARRNRWLILAALLLAVATPGRAQQLLGQTEAMRESKSAGCTASGCHVGIEPMHASAAVRLGCTDCHGGEASATSKAAAHVSPKYPKRWPSSANPERTYTLLNDERPEFVRFINPGDLRAAPKTCGSSGCHADVVYKVERSLMTHGAFLWGAALYNNGAYPLKDPRFGESYAPDGTPRRLVSRPEVTPEQQRTQSLLPFLDPLPNFESTEPGNTLRVFERGDGRLSNRGFGTLTRTDPVFQGMQKTRLFDPLLSFLGTNDQPGDYRSSGCTACHVVYANDRDPFHSGPYAQYGNLGKSFTADPTIPKDESGHPIRHRLTRAIPSSQCIVCHHYCPVNDSLAGGN